MMGKGRALALSAATVTTATLLGRIFGFAREVVVAHKFGASHQTDAYITALTIPNQLYSLMVMGALGASFIPIFSGLLANEREKDAWRLASTVLNILLISFGTIALAIIVFAPKALLIIAPGFRGTEQLVLGADLLRLMAPALILLGISGLFAGILNSYNHFAAPSLVALVQNVIMVISILVLADKIGLYGAAVGLLLGSLGQVLVQIPAIIKRRIPIYPSLRISHEKLVDIGKIFLPVLIALSASQSNIIIDKTFASYLTEGSITYLNNAYKVASLPVGTLIAAIAIVLFPTFSKQAAQDDIAALRQTISVGIRIVIIVAIPASMSLFVLNVPIIRLLFEHGAFTAANTSATAPVLSAYSVGLVMMGLNMLLMRAFYALKDGSTPLKASLVFVIALIGFDFVLTRFFAHIGLALGYVLAISIMVLIMMRALHIKLNGLDRSVLIVSVYKTSLAAIAMGIITFSVSMLSQSILGYSTALVELTNVVIPVISGMVGYVIVLVLLRTDEISLIKSTVTSKLSKAGV